LIADGQRIPDVLNMTSDQLEWAWDGRQWLRENLPKAGSDGGR